ncbi:WecB/TagA/CpsF family glycosyltransferase [Paracoccus zhejiangensis]|uniref:Glycosyltransferase n=1 Tax=Paracoccus zhejiangensis TaxID=1077935 RepID=A0A2H5EX08_9RHOB|nr:WecB/TagA/CpsF family glycosyltransferase [Paracoccus zhejiangensis]AUH63835.1 glycosyltransferase [Paracoccus zhejiangensis]
MLFTYPDGQVVRVNCPDREALLSGVAARMAANRGFALATLNVDHLEQLARDEAFRRAYAAHDLVCADGNPIVWLSRLAGQPVELVPGSELVHPLAELAARHEAPVALIGGSEASVRLAAERLMAAHPGLEVVMQAVPGFPFDPDASEAARLIGQIANSGAQLCLLGLGAPRQERFAIRARDALPGVGFASIGAGIDFISGQQQRAPVFMRKAKMEWLWRMLSNPRRLAARYGRGFLILPGHVRRALAQRGKV